MSGARVVMSLCLLLGAWLPQRGEAQVQGRVMRLALPHTLRAAQGEAVWLELSVGPLRRGREIGVSMPGGRTLGTISPHGIRSGHGSGTYTLPIPAEAIVRDTLVVVLSVEQGGCDARAPTRQEVRRVRLVVR